MNRTSCIILAVCSLVIMVLVVVILVLLLEDRGAQDTQVPTPPVPSVVWTATPLPPGSNLPITPVVTQATTLAAPTGAPTVAATFEVLPTETVVPSTSTPGSELQSVVFVLSDDVLNVRNPAGVENPKVAGLAPNTRGVVITGAGQQVGPSLWVPIQVDDVVGWVNSRFLTTQVESEVFCQDPQIQAIVQNLTSAVNNRDGQALAALVHPQRGLRLRHDWWNNEVKLVGGEVSRVFNDPTARDWGRANGSGQPITGSFSDVILPLLDKDLVGATESTCGEILGGGTAGILKLPEEYEAVNFYSHYRPAPSEDAFGDWGSWVIGIEYWDGQPYLSFLVHYAREI